MDSTPVGDCVPTVPVSGSLGPMDAATSAGVWLTISRSSCFFWRDRSVYAKGEWGCLSQRVRLVDYTPTKRRLPKFRSRFMSKIFCADVSMS